VAELDVIGGAGAIMGIGGQADAGTTAASMTGVSAASESAAGRSTGVLPSLFDAGADGATAATMPANRPSLAAASADAEAVPPVAVGTIGDRTLNADIGGDRAFARGIGAYCTRWFARSGARSGPSAEW